MSNFPTKHDVDKAIQIASLILKNKDYLDVSTSLQPQSGDRVHCSVQIAGIVPRSEITSLAASVDACESAASSVMTMLDNS